MTSTALSRKLHVATKPRLKNGFYYAHVNQTQINIYGKLDELQKEINALRENGGIETIKLKGNCCIVARQPLSDSECESEVIAFIGKKPIYGMFLVAEKSENDEFLETSLFQLISCLDQIAFVKPLRSIQFVSF